MEDMTPKLCINCKEQNALEDSNFCSHICFEIWYSFEQVKVLNIILNKVLNENFGVKNANTRPS